MMDIIFSTGAEMSKLQLIPLRNSASWISFLMASTMKSTNGCGYTWHALARPQVPMLVQARALRLPQHFT